MTERRDHEDPRLSALYRRTPRQEPDRETDAAIRRQAHRAVRHKRPGRFWMPGLAVAATLLIGTVLTLRVLDFAPKPLLEAELSAPAGVAKPALEAERSESDVASRPRLEAKKTAPAWIAEPSLDSEAAFRMLPSAPQRRAASPPENAFSELARGPEPCGQASLAGVSDSRRWRVEIARLREAGEHDLADCLQRFLEQRVQGGEPR